MTKVQFIRTAHGDELVRAAHSTSAERLPFRRPSPIASRLARIPSWLFVTSEG
jgi:hypothetical protein